MDWVAWVTFGIAVVGATLGVFNAFWAVRRDTVRIRVRYYSVILAGVDGVMPAIEVTNTGYFAVTLNEVAFAESRFANRRAPMLQDYLGKVDLPARLEPRASVTVAARPGSDRELVDRQFRYVVATTACGVVARAPIEGLPKNKKTYFRAGPTP